MLPYCLVSSKFGCNLFLIKKSKNNTVTFPIKLYTTPWYVTFVKSPIEIPGNKAMRPKIMSKSEIPAEPSKTPWPFLQPPKVIIWKFRFPYFLQQYFLKIRKTQTITTRPNRLWNDTFLLKISLKLKAKYMHLSHWSTVREYNFPFFSPKSSN